jgi:hypothetical protein
VFFWQINHIGANTFMFGGKAIIFFWKILYFLDKGGGILGEITVFFFWEI